MDRVFLEVCTEKLLLLEEIAGRVVSGELMAPIRVRSADVMELQQVAKNIAAHVGLAHLTFIVTPVKRSEHEAARIELGKDQQEVFIEINPDVLGFHEMVGAVLCHEITHKWLQVHGISTGNSREDEFLTDIAAVYLGLGRSLLNGYHARRVERSGMTRRLHEAKVGYLDLERLAAVYGLMCWMREIPRVEYLHGLNEEAAVAVRRFESQWLREVQDRYGEVRGPELLQVDVRDVQRALVEALKIATWVRIGFIERLEESAREGLETIANLEQRLERLARRGRRTGRLGRLVSILVRLTTERALEQVAAVRDRAERLARDARKAAGAASRTTTGLSAPNPEWFRLISCPRDGTRLRLPVNSGDVIVRCPRCGYTFACNSSCPVVREPVTV